MKVYTGPETGRKYDLAAGDKIDPAAEGIAMTGDKDSPHAKIAGQEKYRRIFIRLRTPDEVLTYRPIEDGEDFANRLAIIEQWYNAHIKDRPVMLSFEALPMDANLTDLELEADQPNKRDAFLSELRELLRKYDATICDYEAYEIDITVGGEYLTYNWSDMGCAMHEEGLTADNIMNYKL